VFKYSVIFLTVAVATMISGAATIHLEMYNIFNESENCTKKQDLPQLVRPVVRGIAIVIFFVRTI
jgi:hypothetical protein